LKVSKTTKTNFPNFIKKLSTLKFLDPACGCGNFLGNYLQRIAFVGIRNFTSLKKQDKEF
jgi:hypothetical protein